MCGRNFAPLNLGKDERDDRSTQKRKRIMPWQMQKCCVFLAYKVKDAATQKLSRHLKLYIYDHWVEIPRRTRTMGLGPMSWFSITRYRPLSPNNKGKRKQCTKIKFGLPFKPLFYFSCFHFDQGTCFLGSDHIIHAIWGDL